MTIAEKIYHDGKEEGKIENMHEMIEFALELKFGLTSKLFAEEVKKIDDYEKLFQISFFHFSNWHAINVCPGCVHAPGLYSFPWQ